MWLTHIIQRLRCGTVRDSKSIHAAIKEIPNKNLDLFFNQFVFLGNSPDWLRSLLILPVHCRLTYRKCYCEIKFI